MSVADPFTHFGFFPFCLSNTIPGGYDKAGGLTLSQLTQVWWSLELLTVETNGVYETDETSFVTLEASFDTPGGVAVSKPEQSSLYDLSDGPVPPFGRGCISTPTAVAFTYTDTGASTPIDYDIRIVVGPDPDTPGMYALYYRIYVQAYYSGTVAALIINPAYGLVGGAAEFSGTIDFGGIGLDWIGGGVNFDAGTWVSGGTDFSISITPYFFTYP